MTTAAPLTIYSTTWCGSCVRLKRQLDREGIDYVDVDIERTPEAAEFVMNANQGNQTVPTVVLPDGEVLTDPAVGEVLRRIRRVGDAEPREAS